MLAGPAVLLHLQPFLSASLDGRIYSDSFYEPYAAWYPELPEAVYVGLLWLAAVAAVAMTIGVLTRLATATTFGIVAYNLFLSTTHFHNNRAYLVIVLGLLAVAPARDATTTARRPGRCGCSASSAARSTSRPRFSKLVDPDWFGGTVTWQRVVHARADLDAWILPDWAVSLLTDRSFHTGAAKLIVLTELFIAIGLWWPRTRYAAVWVAVVFHLTIEASASVQVFSYLAICVLVVWAVPSTRDRVLRLDPASARHRRLGSRRARARLAGALPRRAPRRRARRSRSWIATAARCAAARRWRSRSAGCRSPPGSRSPRCSCPPSGGRDERTRARRAQPGLLALILVFAFGVRGAAGALPVRRAGRAPALRPGGGGLVRAQPEPGRHLAVRVHRRREHDVGSGRVQLGPPRRAPRWASTRPLPRACRARFAQRTGAPSGRSTG